MFMNCPMNCPKVAKNLRAVFKISMSAGLVSEAPGDKGRVPPRQCWTAGSQSHSHGGGRRKVEAALRRRLGAGRCPGCVADAVPPSRRPLRVVTQAASPFMAHLPSPLLIPGASEAWAAPGQQSGLHVPSRDPPGVTASGQRGWVASGASLLVRPQATVARSTGDGRLRGQCGRLRTLTPGRGGSVSAVPG